MKQKKKKKVTVALRIIHNATLQTRVIQSESLHLCLVIWRFVGNKYLKTSI